MASITSITYRPDASTEPLPPVGYRRVALHEALLVAGVGIEHDSKGGALRNLNIMDTLSLAELAAEGFPTTPGALGENIVVDDLDLCALPRGAHLRLGKDVMVEIMEPRTGCIKLHRIDARMPDAVQGRVGVMARVTRGGRIKVGDRVAVVSAAQPVENALSS